MLHITNMYDFTGKKILVTGAGRGIGRGIAIALAKSGCHVYALSRTQSTLDSLVAEYPSISPITVDLSNWNDTRAKLEVLETMDGLVNNAGIEDELCSSLERSRESIESILNVNLVSAINCIQVIGKKMVAGGKGGSIVNNSSVNGICAYPHGLNYCVSKAGLDMVTKQFALELGPHNIRVNSVNPTVVKTELTQGCIDKGFPVDETYAKQTPMERVCDVDEAVQPFLYLLSDKCTMVTGTCHVIDGGMLSSIIV